MGCSKSSSKREVYNNTVLPQETRNISNKQPNLTPNAIEKEEQNKTKQKQKTEKNFFSSAHGTFFRINHIMGHKSKFGKFKKIEIV